MSYFSTKKINTFGIKPSSLCSFCNFYDETPYQIFYECDRVKCLRSDLVQCFQNNLILPTLTPQTAIFGFLDYTNNDSIFENNTLRFRIIGGGWNSRGVGNFSIY